MTNVKTCPVCKSGSVAKYGRMAISRNCVLYEIMPGVKVKAAILSFYYICRDCGLVFQNPRFSDSELERFYSQGYYRRTHFLSVKKADQNEITRAGVDAGIIKKNVGKINSHLDVGCSRGYLLREMDAEVGVGVEPNSRYVKVKGIKIYPKLGLVPYQKFDLVTAIHVLEHVADPLKFLKTMRKFVKESGFLAIEVPVSEKGLAPIGLEHLYYFEPEVLRKLCVWAGLKVVNEYRTPHLLFICRQS